MLRWITDLSRILGQSQHWTQVEPSFLVEVLPVSGVKVMLPLVWDLFDWFKAFYQVTGLFDEVVCVGGVRVEFVSVWVGNVRWGPAKLGVWSLWEEVGLVCRWTVEGLHAWVELLVLVSQSVLCHAFRLVGALVPRLSFKRNVLLLILHSRYHFMPHMRLMSRIVLSIGRINVTIRCLQVLRV